jgi:hypothetical protein
MIVEPFLELYSMLFKGNEKVKKHSSIWESLGWILSNIVVPIIVETIKSIARMARFIASVWKFTTEWLKEKIEGFKETIDLVIPYIIDWFKDLGKSIEDFVMGPINKVTGAFGSVKEKASSILGKTADFFGFGGEEQKVIQEKNIATRNTGEFRNRLDINLAGNTDAVSNVQAKEDRNTYLNIGENMPLEGTS